MTVESNNLSHQFLDAHQIMRHWLSAIKLHHSLFLHYSVVHSHRDLHAVHFTAIAKTIRWVVSAHRWHVLYFAVLEKIIVQPLLLIPLSVNGVSYNLFLF